MQSITFECEVITPMFLAGADGVTPELRPPSIKGALRFWWRAMHGHLSLEELKKQEEEIFGGAAGETGKKSSIRIRVESGNLEIKRLTRENYLNYGMKDRGYFEEGSNFKTIFQIRHEKVDFEKKILEDIKDSFSLLCYFGGIGSKSRNGYGAFHSNNLVPFEEICKKSFLNNQLSKYTSLSKETLIYLTNVKSTDSQVILSELEVLYKTESRSKILSKFRHFIGAPFKNIKFPARHGKLFLMSVMKESKSDEYMGVIIYLPYQYLKDYPDLKLTDQENLRINWEKTMKTFKDFIFNSKNVDKTYRVNQILK